MTLIDEQVRLTNIGSGWHKLDTLVFRIWLEEDWVPWVMVGKIVPDRWLLTFALINTLLVLMILIRPEGEEETMPYIPKNKRPLKPPNKCIFVVGCLLEIARCLDNQISSMEVNRMK